MNRLKLEPPPQLRELLEIAVETEDTGSTKLSKDEIVEVRPNALLHPPLFRPSLSRHIWDANERILMVENL